MRDEKDPQQVGNRENDSPPPEVPEIRTLCPVGLTKFQENLLIKVEQGIIDHRDLCPKGVLPLVGSVCVKCG
jgi:hypothetical protein